MQPIQAFPLPVPSSPAQPIAPAEPARTRLAPESIATSPASSPQPRPAEIPANRPVAPLSIPHPRSPAGAAHAGPLPPAGAVRTMPRHVQPDGNGAEHHEDEPADHTGAAGTSGATGPQLRRFIKSRAYVPMHELRRRFVINGGDDDVTPVDLAERRRVFVGLPQREGRLLGELLRSGDIGYELSLDPITPIVVGVYPMRPVTRA